VRSTVNVLPSLILTTSLLLLSGCSSFGLFGGPKVEPVVVKTEAVARTPLNLPDPAPISARPLKWIVITPDNADEVWEKLKKSNTDLVLFGITDQGYEELSITMMEIRNFIANQKTIIIKYREYYEPVDVPPK
jgi:hypothetical protein